METTKPNFNFSQQLKIGDTGERMFEGYYDPIYGVTKAETPDYDFLLGNGEKVELKTDTYALDETKNFFFEKFSDIKTKKLGGPWRAKRDMVNYFVYLYIKDKTFYWFNPVLLCSILDKITKKMHTKYIKNIAWTTSGYAVPRESCMNVCFKTEKIT